MPTIKNIYYSILNSVARLISENRLRQLKCKFISKFYSWPLSKES